MEELFEETWDLSESELKALENIARFVIGQLPSDQGTLKPLVISFVDGNYVEENFGIVIPQELVEGLNSWSYIRQIVIDGSVVLRQKGVTSNITCFGGWRSEVGNEYYCLFTHEIDTLRDNSIASTLSLALLLSDNMEISEIRTPEALDRYTGASKEALLVTQGTDYGDYYGVVLLNPKGLTKGKFAEQLIDFCLSEACIDEVSDRVYIFGPLFKITKRLVIDDGRFIVLG